LVYALTLTHVNSQFSQQVVLRILNTCVLDFCVHHVWSDHSEFMAFFYGL